MSHLLRVPALLLLAIAGAAAAAADDAEEISGADAFVTCSACHLADGAGVPGAFPPLRNRASTIAELEGGRQYLITAVAYGLMGTIEVGDMPYFGVMAGNGAAMDPAAIAAALNYIVFQLVDEPPVGIEPFTAAEVARVQAEVSPRSPAAAWALRKALVDKHGDRWP